MNVVILKHICATFQVAFSVCKIIAVKRWFRNMRPYPELSWLRATIYSWQSKEKLSHFVAIPVVCSVSETARLWYPTRQEVRKRSKVVGNVIERWKQFSKKSIWVLATKRKLFVQKVNEWYLNGTSKLPQSLKYSIWMIKKTCVTTHLTNTWEASGNKKPPTSNNMKCDYEP